MVMHITYYIQNYNICRIHNRKCSNMQMAHITHTNNGQCTMFVCVYEAKLFIHFYVHGTHLWDTECTLCIAIQHKEIDIWRLHSITKYNNNILCISFHIWCDKLLLRRPFTIHIYIGNETNLITFAKLQRLKQKLFSFDANGKVSIEKKLKSMADLISCWQFTKSKFFLSLWQSSGSLNEANDARNIMKSASSCWFINIWISFPIVRIGQEREKKYRTRLVITWISNEKTSKWIHRKRIKPIRMWFITFCLKSD